MSISQWESLTRGDKNAFIEIYESHYQSLFTYGFSITANREQTKDCIQDLFYELWTKRSTLNKEVKNIRFYLFTWLRRKITKELKQTGKETHVIDHMDHKNDQVLPYEELLIAFEQSEEAKLKLTAALRKLTNRQLEIIRLRFFENLSYEQIAINTSLTERTVYNIVYESIRQLRILMRFILFYF